MQGIGAEGDGAGRGLRAAASAVIWVGHLCPSALRGELEQLSGSVEVHITHIKPGEGEAVMGAVSALTTPHRISALRAGDEMVF